MMRNTFPSPIARSTEARLFYSLSLRIQFKAFFITLPNVIRAEFEGIYSVGRSQRKFSLSQQIVTSQHEARENEKSSEDDDERGMKMILFPFSFVESL